MINYTIAKQKVRELNKNALVECLELSKTRRKIRYFGLPAPKIEDLRLLKEYLSAAHAVERGIPGREHILQHALSVEAIKNGIPGFRLYRGDIDDIILGGHDTQNIFVEWPYDFINLDYTGGILYKDASGKSKRISALKQLLQKQGEKEASFFLSISVNDKHHDAGEIKNVINGLLTNQQSTSKTEDTDAIVNSSDMRRAVFIYTSYVVAHTSASWFCPNILNPIIYTGNGGYKMLNMSFCLKYLQKRDAPATSYKGPSKLLQIKFINLDE